MVGHRASWRQRSSGRAASGRGGIAGKGIIHQCRHAEVGAVPATLWERDSLASTTPLNPPPAHFPPGDIVAEVEALGERLSLVRERIGEVIFGQREVVEQALITLLSGGHALLIGVPGLAKTRLVETLGIILGVDDKRIQCTPDLMPADILGSEVLEESESGRRSFRFIPGPVFCQLLMADEINRASPRTHSALLQAMQEGRVSIAGQYHSAAAPVPDVLGDAKPAGAGGHLPRCPRRKLSTASCLQIDVDFTPTSIPSGGC